MDFNAINLKEQEEVETMDDGSVERVSTPKALRRFTWASIAYIPVGTYTTLGLIGYIPYTAADRWSIWLQTILLALVVRTAIPLRISMPVLAVLMVTALLFGPTVFIYINAWFSGTGQLDVEVLEFVTQDTNEYLESHELF